MRSAKTVINKILASRGYAITRTDKIWKDIERISGAEEAQLIRRVIEEGLTMTSPAKLQQTLAAVTYAVKNGIEGDFVECGVWAGGSAIAIAVRYLELAKSHAVKRQIYCFDTFAGMTSPEAFERSAAGESAQDLFVSRESQEGAWLAVSQDQVMSNIANFGLDLRHFRFVGGDVQETLREPANLPDSIALLRLDTDFYKSTLVELEVLYPLVSDFGIVILDDYDFWSGSRRAFEDFTRSQGLHPFLGIADAARAFIKIPRVKREG